MNHYNVWWETSALCPKVLGACISYGQSHSPIPSIQQFSSWAIAQGRQHHHLLLSSVIAYCPACLFPSKQTGYGRSSYPEQKDRIIRGDSGSGCSWMFPLTTRRVRKPIIIHTPNEEKPHRGGDGITGKAACNSEDAQWNSGDITHDHPMSC